MKNRDNSKKKKREEIDTAQYSICKTPHITDYRFGVSVCVTSEDQVGKDKRQWNSARANCNSTLLPKCH